MLKWAVVAALSLIASAGSLSADMRGVDALGKEVILHDDGTWSYASPAPAAGGADIVVLRSGKVLMKDADVYEYSYRNWNNANWGKWTSIALGSNINGVPDTRRRVYIKFDAKVVAEAMPPGARVYLRLTGEGRDGDTHAVARVLRVTSLWREGMNMYHSGQVEPDAALGAISWNTQPAIDMSVTWARMQLAPKGPFEADITDLVEAWSTGALPNYGLVLVGETEGSGRYYFTFNSTETTIAKLRPSLVVREGGTRKSRTGNLVVNGSFEDATEGNGLTGGIAGWKVTRDNIDVVGGYWQQTDGRFSLDLAGSDGHAAIRQVIETKPGERYRLSFMMAGNPGCETPDKRLAVRAAGTKRQFQFNVSGHSPADMGWQPQIMRFVALRAKTAIAFAGVGPNVRCGAVLDKVSVTRD